MRTCTSMRTRGNLTYRKDGADLGLYSKVMLDRVEVWIDTEDRYKGASWMDVRRCAELFEDAMRQALADGYPLVDEPGADVLRIRLAVTGVQADVSGYSTRENLGYGDPDTVDVISTTGTELDIETISVEADFLDSSTEERPVRRCGATLGRRRTRRDFLAGGRGCLRGNGTPSPSRTRRSPQRTLSPG